MKIQYTYTEYKDFPRATEISKSRERKGSLLAMSAMCWLLISVIMLFAYPEDWPEGVTLIIICVAALYYMFKIYPKVTAKKVQKAIEEGIAEKQRIEEMIASRPKGVSLIDYRDSTLIVIFKNGLEYRHYDVPRHIYEEFNAAPSKEDYYNSHIKNKYPCW